MKSQSKRAVGLDKLIRWRRRAGLTQSQAAAAVGLSLRSFMRVESGGRLLRDCERAALERFYFDAEREQRRGGDL